MIKNTGRILMTLVSLAFFNIAEADDKVKISRIEGQINFDGRPSEASWETASKFPLIMHKPNFGNEPSEKTEVMIGYDNEYLWVGARLFMSDPKKIFTPTKKRDEMMFGLDALGIILDTYNDNENALAFYTTPTGLRSDYEIANDGAMNGGDPFAVTNYSWNTFWDVKTTRDENGWYVEMRIPFSSLRFKTENDIATMGLIIIRNIGSNSEVDTYPSIDPKYGFMAINKPSIGKKITIEGARPQKPVYVSPYVIGGFSRSYPMNESGTSYDRKDKPVFNAGLDVKYNLNSKLTLDLTANTDFAQVEADDQMVNLTRYSLYFPEKRMFFQERSSLFSFSLGGHSDNLFYSRNIGIVDQTPVKIYGGARLVGRVGNWDLGFLDMQTEKFDQTPGENFGLLRLRRQVINPNSYVGGIFTSRIGANGKYNLAYGLDGIFRIFGDDYISVKWAQAYDSKTIDSIKGLEPSFIQLMWERRSEEGLGYNISYIYSGERFNPGIGFIQRGSVWGINANISYGFLPGEKSKLFNYMFFVRSDRFTRLSDGKLESMAIEPGFEINTKKELHLELGAEIQQEGVKEEFPLSDSVKIKAGDYTFTTLQAMIGTSESKKVSVNGDIFAGQFFDGNRIGIRPMIKLNLTASLKMELGYEFNALRFPDRVSNKKLDIHSVNSRAVYMFSTKISATVFVQYVTTQNELVSNFRLRYNPREGNDFYLVLNDYRSMGKKEVVPILPAYFDRTIMVKYTHTFIF